MSTPDRPEYVINGFPLPTALIDAIHTGRWRPPPDTGRLEAVFSHPPEHPSFYDLEQMRFENLAWHKETYDGYFGAPDSARPPGDLHPTQSVLIGDLAPDLPFALDYRTAPTPRIVFLTDEGDASRWVTTADSIENLLQLLRL